jgi:hypothetical protein
LYYYYNYSKCIQNQLWKMPIDKVLA